MKIYFVGTTVEIKHCKACGKEWCFRGSGRALRCGKCKSPYWDQPKKGLKNAGIRDGIGKIDSGRGSTHRDVGDSLQGRSSSGKATSAKGNGASGKGNAKDEGDCKIDASGDPADSSSGDSKSSSVGIELPSGMPKDRGEAGHEGRIERGLVGAQADPLPKSKCFPNSKCPHGWQNSFACEKGNGGCHR